MVAIERDLPTIDIRDFIDSNLIRHNRALAHGDVPAASGMALWGEERGRSPQTARYAATLEAAGLNSDVCGTTAGARPYQDQEIWPCTAGTYARIW
jgi:hypothetical protein